MKPHSRSKQLILASVVLAALGSASVSFAQYQWRDASGKLVISDQPPPASVKPSQIISSKPMPKAAPAPAPAPAASAKPDAGKAPMTMAEKDLAFKKRQQDKAEAEKSSAQKQAEADAKAKHCEALRGNLRTLQSGMKINQVEKSGEARAMEAAEREVAIGKANRDIAAQCS